MFQRLKEKFQKNKDPSETPTEALKAEDQKENSGKELPPVQPGATYALTVLTIINLLNYIDRYVPSSTKDLIKADLNLTDTETSIPLTSFLIVYIITSPIFGHLSDHGVSRKILISSGIVIWSICTAGAFFAKNFTSFLILRSLVGIGEAAYATITPALLADFYSPPKRNKALTIFYTAIPVGAALGFLLGGEIGQAIGWRYAFLICGLPGILIALLILFIHEPERGVYDSKDKKEPAPSWIYTIKYLARNKNYLNAVIGYIFVTFAAGGIADWIPTFLTRVDGVSVGTAGTLVGGVTVIGGIGGTLLGGYLGDFFKGKVRQPYLFLSWITVIPAAIGGSLILIIYNWIGATLILLFAQIALWCYNGPINTVIVSSVEPKLRTRAQGACILAIHALGDAISPVIIGAISDRTGSLVIAVSIIPVALCFAVVAWAIGWWYLKLEVTEQQKPEEGIELP